MRAKGAGDGLPFAVLDWHGWNVGANWRKLIHPLFDIRGQHHFAGHIAHF